MAGNDVVDYGVGEVPPGTPAPIPDAVAGGDVVVSVQIPVRADGDFEDGDIRAQTALALENLRSALALADLGLDRVMHVTVYLTDMQDWAGMNEVWQSVFADRSPSRAAIGTTALAHPSMRVEMVALVAR